MVSGISNYCMDDNYTHPQIFLSALCIRTTVLRFAQRSKEDIAALVELAIDFKMMDLAVKVKFC